MTESDDVHGGRGCAQPARVFVPRIDRNRCEGKADCVIVRPHDVLLVDTLPPGERNGLSLRGRLKGLVHRWQQSLAVNAGACHACGLCVSACPEQAITLRRA